MLLPDFFSDCMRTWFILCVSFLALMGLAGADEHLAQRYQDISLAYVVAADAALRQPVLTTEQPNELELVHGDEQTRISVPELVNIERVFRQPDGSLLVSGLTAAGRTGFYLYSDTGGTRNVTPENLPDWCVPIMPVQRGQKHFYLAQAAPQPMSGAPLYLLRLEGEKPSCCMLYPNRSHATAYALRKNGTPLARLNWAADGSKQICYRRSDGTVCTALSAAAADRLQLLGAAGKQSVYVVHDINREGACLAELHLPTGSLKTVAEAGRADVVAPFFSPDGELLGFSSLRGKLVYTPLRSCPIVEQLERSLPPDCEWLPLQLSQDGKRLLLRLSPAGQPPRPAIFDSERGLQELAAPQDIPPTRPTHFAEYPARDGTRIPVYYTLPEGRGPFPTVLFVHGGPRARTDAGYDWRVQYLVSQGYAVAQPQFRGSRGWGKSFMHAGNRQWGTGVMQTDVYDCIPWLAEQGIAERGRIAILGGSYGGYAVTAALCFSPGTFACGISLFGPQDLLLHLRQMNEVDSPFGGEDALTVGDINDPADRERLRAISPVYHAENFRDPLLLYYGGKDTLIPPQHSIRLAEALRRAGKEVTVHTHAEEAHGFLHPCREPQFYANHIVPFLNQHLRHSQTTPQP